MSMLADRVDYVIGVDTHRDAHTVAVCTPTGAVIAETTVVADAFGYTRLLRFAREQAPGRRVWAIEGTGSFGAGLTAFLLEQTEWVVEVDRPARPARRNGAKSDQLDAARAANEALSRQHLAQPRRRGEREALRVLLATRQGAILARTQAIGQLKGLIINAPEQLRHQLRQLTTNEQLARCARLRTSSSHSIEQQATIIALRCAARRALALGAEAAELEARLRPLVRELAPGLLAEPGVGVISAAQILNAWSHPGRFRSGAAFASLAGTAPIPASSGQLMRHRLNHGGDRQLNRALHTHRALSPHPPSRDQALRSPTDSRRQDTTRDQALPQTPPRPPPLPHPRNPPDRRPQTPQPAPSTAITNERTLLLTDIEASTTHHTPSSPFPQTATGGRVEMSSLRSTAVRRNGVGYRSIRAAGTAPGRRDPARPVATGRSIILADTLVLPSDGVRWNACAFRTQGLVP
jgi:transposase